MLLALLEVTVTGPEMLIGLLAPIVMGPLPRDWVTPMGPTLALAGLTTETWPKAVLECWMETEALIGVGSRSEDLPSVRGFTDID